VQNGERKGGWGDVKEKRCGGIGCALFPNTINTAKKEGQKPETEEGGWINTII
jgi:hypothetical protein